MADAVRMLCGMLWAGVALLALAGCGAAPPESAQAGATGGARIISMGPNITETLFAIGAGAQVVGISDFCQWPEEALARPRIGGPATPNLEQITVLRPDVIVMQFESAPVRRFAEDRGIRLEQVRMEDLASIRRDIGVLGRVAGREDAATSLVARIDRELDVLAEKVAAIPEERRPKVFLSLEREAGSLGAILTAGEASFLHEALRLAGGQNVFGDVRRPYTEVSSEALVERAPEVVLELKAERLDARARAGLVDDWTALGSVPAVRDGRIVVLTEPAMLVPGPRFAEIVRLMQEAIYQNPTPSRPNN